MLIKVTFDIDDCPSHGLIQVDSNDQKSLRQENPEMLGVLHGMFIEDYQERPPWL